jgi:hypothetical protein
MKRPYTGTKDGISKGKRAGTEQWVKEISRLSGGALWNNGTWGVRDIRGTPGVLSVHATGRAMDLSYRKTGDKGVPKGRQETMKILRLIVPNAELLGIECILDYFPQPWGRGWRCDRNAWQRYTRKTISGAPGGDWLHIEISPTYADNPELVRQAFAQLRQNAG